MRTLKRGSSTRLGQYQTAAHFQELYIIGVVQPFHTHPLAHPKSAVPTTVVFSPPVDWCLKKVLLARQQRKLTVDKLLSARVLNNGDILRVKVQPRLP
jgi:hypothetical protein